MRTTTSPLESAHSRNPRGDGFQPPDRKLQDEWARQLAAMLTAPSVLDAPLPEATAAPSPSIGGQTSTMGDRVGSLIDDGDSDATGDKRLTLTVRTPELGEVTIVIDRAEGGVRVVLGVEASLAGRALEAEKSALLRSLRAVGLDVHSVSVIQQNKVGTVLAGDRSARSSARSPDDETGAENPEVRRRHKTLKLIG